MQVKITLLLCGLLAGAGAMAGSYEWTAGWGMGVSEYGVDDGNGNELSISCPNYAEDGDMSASATIAGKYYSSQKDVPGEGSFDVIIDGETYSNPFYTACHVCGDNFPGFWKALRQANRLQLAAEGRVINLPTQNIATVLPPLESPNSSCRSAW